MRRITQILLRLLLLSLLAGCGGAQNAGPSSEEAVPEPEYTADDFSLRPELTRAELTVEVDEERYRAAAAPDTRFSATERTIYLVGKLKNIPALASIEVRWFIDADEEPLVVSAIDGANNLQFIASFQPAEEKFYRGSYTARVYVNDSEIGAVPFEVFDAEMDTKGPKVAKLALSKDVTKKHKPKGETRKFPSGTKKVFTSFEVKRTDPGATAEVNWVRDTEQFHNQDIRLGGNQRYSAHIESPEGLPTGAYRVEISIDGMRLASKTFVVGNPGAGPAIEKVVLGTELGPGNMPKKAKSKFKTSSGGIICGLWFLDLLPESVIELQWVQIDGGDEIVRYNNRTNIPNGGEGVMNAAWEPNYTFESGSYKVVVLVNDQPLAEQPFEME